jgi:hypothetical protein
MRASLQQTLMEVMQRQHASSAKSISLHDTAIWMHLVRLLYYRTCFYRFRPPFGSHDGAHPISEQLSPCPLLDERQEMICSIQEAAAGSLDAVGPG